MTFQPTGLASGCWAVTKPRAVHSGECLKLLMLACSKKLLLASDYSWIKTGQKCTDSAVSKGITRGDRRYISLGAESLWGDAKWLRGATSGCKGRRKVPTMSQILSSIQCICFRKTSGSDMGGIRFASCPGRYLTSLRPGSVRCVLPSSIDLRKIGWIKQFHVLCFCRHLVPHGQLPSSW